MALSPEQLNAATAALEQRLQGIRLQGARLTLSPILRGAMSKAEVQLFYEGSRWSAPQRLTFNEPLRQERTLTWRGNLLLSNLNKPEPAHPLLEWVMINVAGWQPFGPQPYLTDPRNGRVAVVSDGFRQYKEDPGLWFYTMEFSTAISEEFPDA